MVLIYKDITTELELEIKKDNEDFNEYYQVGWYTDSEFTNPVTLENGSSSFNKIEISIPSIDSLASATISTPTTTYNEGESIKLEIQGFVEDKGIQSASLYWTATGSNIDAQDFSSIRQVPSGNESFRPEAYTLLEGDNVEGRL